MVLLSIVLLEVFLFEMMERGDGRLIVVVVVVVYISTVD